MPDPKNQSVRQSEVMPTVAPQPVIAEPEPQPVLAPADLPPVFAKFKDKAHDLAVAAYQKAKARGAKEEDCVTDGVIAAKEFLRTGQVIAEDE